MSKHGNAQDEIIQPMVRMYQGLPVLAVLLLKAISCIQMMSRDFAILMQS